MLDYEQIHKLSFVMLIYDKSGFSMLDYDQFHKLSFCYVRLRLNS
jgi:hypothetical protein